MKAAERMRRVLGYRGGPGSCWPEAKWITHGPGGPCFAAGAGNTRLALAVRPGETVSSLQRLQPSGKIPGLRPSETWGWMVIGEGAQSRPEWAQHGHVLTGVDDGALSTLDWEQDRKWLRQRLAVFFCTGVPQDTSSQSFGEELRCAGLSVPRVGSSHHVCGHSHEQGRARAPASQGEGQEVPPKQAWWSSVWSKLHCDGKCTEIRMETYSQVPCHS